MKDNRIAPLLLMAVLAGCATNRSTVGDGTFQKRRIGAGWHVDLGMRRNTRAPEKLERSDTARPATLTARPIPHPEPLAYAEPLADAPLVGMTEPVTPASMGTQDVVVLKPTVPITVNQPPSSPEDSIGKWNPWAVPAFVVALGTVAYALLGTSELIVVAAVVLTLVLASIAVRKGRTNEWRGKGFAVAALMIGALGALITLIALLAG